MLCKGVPFMSVPGWNDCILYNADDGYYFGTDDELGTRHIVVYCEDLYHAEPAGREPHRGILLGQLSAGSPFELYTGILQPFQWISDPLASSDVPSRSLFVGRAVGADGRAVNRLYFHEYGFQCGEDELGYRKRCGLYRVGPFSHRRSRVCTKHDDP